MYQNDYVQAINQAIDYIHENADKNLTVEEIADHCCFSKYYFNRVFKSIVKESIYSFIKRMKLENAAFKLRTGKSRSITEIALESGYSPSNFATAFKEYFGMSASEFRANNSVPVKDSYRSISEHIAGMKKQEDFYSKIDSRIKVRQLPEMLLLYERFIGNYYDLDKTWDTFCRKLEGRGLIGENSILMGISYDDPLIADENKCMYDMCVTVDSVREPNTHRIEAGLYACYDFYDRLENLGKAFNEIFALWLPYSGYCIDNRPSVEMYRTYLDEEEKIHIEICIPVVKSEND